MYAWDRGRRARQRALIAIDGAQTGGGAQEGGMRREEPAADLVDAGDDFRLETPFVREFVPQLVRACDKRLACCGAAPAARSTKR